ncbi:MAG: DUF4446 family protein [Candidatus Pacebacteria bacterium]|nr:DUF4446 family protein [Candidatus Paceibacterota bacterium]
MEAPIISVDVFLYILSGIIVVLTIWIIRLELKLRRFLIGKNAKSLEDSFLFIKKEVGKQDIVNREIATEIDKINGKLEKSLRGVGIVRFNPFQGAGGGGNQSFAIALLDDKHDGLILSSLYSRERFSAFAKPIKEGNSTFELTKEESQALQKAKETL